MALLCQASVGNFDLLVRCIVIHLICSQKQSGSFLQSVLFCKGLLFLSVTKGLVTCGARICRAQGKIESRLWSCRRVTSSCETISHCWQSRRLKDRPQGVHNSPQCHYVISVLLVPLPILHPVLPTRLLQRDLLWLPSMKGVVALDEQRQGDCQTTEEVSFDTNPAAISWLS